MRKKDRTLHNAKIEVQIINEVEKLINELYHKTELIKK